ncbi:unnamed protein product [Arctogadus glacialis]
MSTPRAGGDLGGPGGRLGSGSRREGLHGTAPTVRRGGPSGRTRVDRGGGADRGTGLWGGPTTQHNPVGVSPGTLTRLARRGVTLLRKVKRVCPADGCVADHYVAALCWFQSCVLIITAAGGELRGSSKHLILVLSRVEVYLRVLEQPA